MLYFSRQCEKRVLVGSGMDKTIMGSAKLDRKFPVYGSVVGTTGDRSADFASGTLQRRGKKWIMQTGVASDLVIQLGNLSFHLHKLPMVSRSGYINRLVFERKSKAESENSMPINLDNVPGGAKTFELVVRFCYGLKLDFTASNIAPLYCAAHFLEMSVDYHESNLIPQTEAFLSFVIFSSWKDIFHVLKSCENLSPWAKELKILNRCSEAIAWKACCTDHKAFNFSTCDTTLFDIQGNKLTYLKVENFFDQWWFEDVSLLRIDHFLEVVDACKRKGMRPDLIGVSIAEWTQKWLSRVTLLDNLTAQKLTYQLQRVVIESLIRVLPLEENSVSCNFLLNLLKVGLLMEIDSDLVKTLERRIAFMLEKCRMLDLLVENRIDGDTTYNVRVIIRVVQCYVSVVWKNHPPKLFAVGRLIDGYLAFVAREERLTVKDFRSLAEALPEDARFCDDNLYRAIDMYIKAHPSITEAERMGICKAMDYHKLSKEACEHALKNDWLPLDMMTRFILMEQVNMMRSATKSGSDYQRTATQAILRTSTGSSHGWLSSQKEVRMMRKEVDAMQAQIRQLQLCKLKLQTQMREAK
ncbi:root phototropism protein 3-like isoform X1 [Syzygium oleosum]|uniref:root phototropism protein 3-like isoform X1 n=2 Tax=Syzygium oleosum TaxID=219896 RepID=UPI0011D1D0E9|nr:root phototropism protein 3-like isoform X1 [Syzygium oleosum]